MTSNQLRLLIDIHTGTLRDCEFYPSTYKQDLKYLKNEGLIRERDAYTSIDTTTKGDYFIINACKIRLRETYEAYL
jgi:hypothetical protein